MTEDKFIVINSNETYKENERAFLQINAEYRYWNFTKLVELIPTFKDFWNQRAEEYIKFDKLMANYELQAKTGEPTEMSKKAYKDFFNEKNIHVLLVSGSDVIGQAAIEAKEKFAILEKVYVKPEYRQNGYGKKILTKMVEICKDLQYTLIKLESAPFMKNAHKMYEEFGFTRIGHFPEVGHSKEFGEEAGAIYMELLL